MPVPIFIEMRAWEKAKSLDVLIAQHLVAAQVDIVQIGRFRRMLAEGRIALLFDGFDELSLRVSYERAVEHFDTLMEAAGGKAKIVLTSRTHHFISDTQVKQALLDKAETVAGLRIGWLQSFDEDQIKQFLLNLIGDEAKAQARFELIRDIRDLLGLSANPRMLSFIADLEETQLRECKEKHGQINPAELYRILIERWLRYDLNLSRVKGAPPPLGLDERWRAVTEAALLVWPKTEGTLRLEELQEVSGKALAQLAKPAELPLEAGEVTHTVGSRTLLVRDAEGAFSFVHQSIMEWLVARRAAADLLEDGDPRPLYVRELTPLATCFFCELADRQRVSTWARSVLASTVDDAKPAKRNALLVLKELREKLTEPASFADQDLSGQDFTGQILANSNFERAILIDARLERLDLSGANLAGASLSGAALTKANLRGANLQGANLDKARLLGADLTGARMQGVNLRRASLAGATFEPNALAECDLFGAALAGQADLNFSLACGCTSIAFSPDGELLAAGFTNGIIWLWVVGCKCGPGTPRPQSTQELGMVRRLQPRRHAPRQRQFRQNVAAVGRGHGPGTPRPQRTQAQCKERRLQPRRHAPCQRQLRQHLAAVGRGHGPGTPRLQRTRELSI
jgi:hypothetical protein